MVERLTTADPEIQQFALDVLAKAYNEFPNKMVEPGGQDLSQNVPLILDSIAKNIVAIPGGYDTLFAVAPQRYPDQALPQQQLFMTANPSQFGPELKEAFKPIILNDVIPEYIEKNRKRLENEIKSHSPRGVLLGRQGRWPPTGLVALYNEAGIHDYDWKRFGPARDKIEWDYFTFDPPEKKMWETGARYREVTLPAGMENWFKPEFNPGAAGWKTGFASFANMDGKLAPTGNCKGPNYFCGCGNPPNTFWDKEVLLMRAKIKLPPMKEGYAYRLLVGGISHFDGAMGNDIWIDGEHLGLGRRGTPSITAHLGRYSHRPIGITITDGMRKHFEDGEVLLACNGFLRWGFKSTVIKNYLSFWFEEMKLPELPEAKAEKEATE